jgi:hypothetical protein
MNLLIKINYILLFVYFGNLLFAQNCSATVSIETNSNDSKLFIDSVFIGQGDYFVTELDTGLHIIQIQKNLWKWNSSMIRDTLKIIECKEYHFNFSFTDKILFDTEPQDVYVFEDDSLVGFTPLLLKPFKDNLTLKKPEYASRTVDYNEISVGKKPVLEFIGKEKSQQFYETFLFKTLVGTAIALGAATAYYKLEADKKFDEYQVTGDPALLEQTDKYDSISGVTFVALQIDFGLILYFFLAN